MHNNNCNPLNSITYSMSKSQHHIQIHLSKYALLDSNQTSPRHDTKAYKMYKLDTYETLC